MPYEEPTYAGDDEHSICCTGDCVIGDEVRFQRAMFEGSHRRPKFAGFEMVTGEIVAENYGAERQQHTFTLLLPTGQKTLIKGRNLYKNEVYRQRWGDEAKRQAALEDKHARGRQARDEREHRRSEAHFPNPEVNGPK